MTDVEPLATTDYDTPLWMQATTYPAGNDRDLIDAVFRIGGVIGQGDLAVAQRGAGANMSVDVAAGLVVVPGTDIAGQGKYMGRLKNTVNVPIAAAPGAGLTRIDLIHAHIADATVIGGALNCLSVETPVVGTAVSSNPAVPATPASSVPLAQITVAAGTASITTAMIADVRPWAGQPPAMGIIRGGYGVSTANSGAVGSTPTVLYGSNVTTAPGRRYKITAFLNVSQQSAQGVVLAQIIEDNTLVLSQVQNVLPANAVQSLYVGAVRVPAAAGFHTYNVYLSTSAGSVYAQASTTQPAWVTVEDVGVAAP
jgi:hypothetical protein